MVGEYIEEKVQGKMIASDLLEFYKNGVNVIGICINFIGIFIVDLLGMEAIDGSWVEMFGVGPFGFIFYFSFIFLIKK